MKRQPPGKPPSQRHGLDPQPEMPMGTLLARLANPNLRKRIEEAGVIFGVDSKTGRVSLFFGKATLERIVRSGKSKQVSTMSIPIDFVSNDLEALCAACLALKGSHCYQTPDGETDAIQPGLN